MKMLLSLLASCAVTALFAQDETPEFGNVMLADFAPTPFDSLSSSIVLFEKGVYGGGFVPETEYHLRVKIITKAAFDLWGDFKIENARPNHLKAATYCLEEGEIVQHILDKKDILVDDYSTRIVTLRQVQEGCIIELNYKASRSFYEMPSWIIQKEVPVLRSEYQLLSPAKLTYLVRGPYQPVHFNPKYKTVFARWVFENIPAFQPEPLMPHPVNYFPRLEFWNPSGSWEKLKDEYLKEYTKWQREFHYDLGRLKIRRLTDTIADPIAKLKTLSRYIKENFTWTQYRSSRPFIYTKIFQEKKGSSGELNILLYAMLKEAGFNPHFALVSTADNGLIIKDVPSGDQFNYVLCSVTVNDKRYLLDATDPLLPFDVVPQFCINMDALVISERGTGWMRIEPNIKERYYVNARLSLSQSKELTGRIAVMKQGYGAYAERKDLNTLGVANFKRESIPDKMWIVDSAAVSQAGEWSAPSVVTHYATLPGYVLGTRDTIYLNPYIMFAEKTNSLSGNQREFPLDLKHKSERQLMVNIEIPEGFRIEGMPRSETFSLPDKGLSCAFKISSDGKNLVVIYLFKIEKTWFEREEFANVREFFNLVIAKQNEMIVLVKDK